MNIRTSPNCPAPTQPKRPVQPKAKPHTAQARYVNAIAAVRKKIGAEKCLPLQDGEQSVLMAHPTPPKKGTIVMYHGFTAGPWQFQQLSQQAYAAGYNVYIPRLPGHGLKTAQGVEDPSGLVKSENPATYAQFAESTYQDARSLGGPVSVMGLSVGGEIALSVAENHPDVKKVVAYAPYMRPAGFGWLVTMLHGLDKVTFGLTGHLLDHLPFGWGAESARQTAEGLKAPDGRAGHSKFSVGNLYAVSEFGRGVIANANKIQAPVQFFTSGADDAADMSAIKQVYQGSGGAGHDGFYEFPKAEGIPHAMVSPREDNGKGQTPALYRMSMQYMNQGTLQNR